MSRWLSSSLLWSSLGAVVLSGGVQAQVAGELTDVGPTGVPAVAPEMTPARSALWQAVDAAFRQRDAGAASDRRLSAEQRQQLREQIRRSASGPVRESRPTAQAEQR